VSLNTLRFTIRNAVEQDTHQLANLIHFELRVHRHLDWRPPLDWIGRYPYLVAEQSGKLVAALACPPDPPEVAWIRLFALADGVSANHVWDEMWPAAKAELRGFDQPIISAVIPLQNWFQKLVEKSEFTFTHNVIVLAWRGDPIPSPRDLSPAIIRPMALDDLPGVETVDREAFMHLWRHSQQSLSMALSQAAIATVVSISGELVGYQISTWTTGGGHLARLAVKPQFQGAGIGYALLQDLLSQFSQRGVHYFTVNTQHNNQISLALYKKAGFKPTGEIYPVYEEQLEN